MPKRAGEFYGSQYMADVPGCQAMRKHLDSDLWAVSLANDGDTHSQQPKSWSVP